MIKKNLRLKALQKAANINESIAIDLPLLKKNGINVNNFIKQIKAADAPYSISESYNFMLVDDVVYQDVLESLHDLGANSEILKKSVVNGMNNSRKFSRLEKQLNEAMDELVDEAYDKIQSKLNEQFDPYPLDDFYNPKFNSEAFPGIHKEWIKDIENGDVDKWNLITSKAKHMLTHGANCYEIEQYFAQELGAEWANEHSNEIIRWYTRNKDFISSKNKFPNRRDSRDSRVYRNTTREERHRDGRNTPPQVYLDTATATTDDEIIYESAKLGNIFKSAEDKAKAQKEVDDLIEEIKKEDFDKKAAKKATTRLKKIKGLKELKRVKSLITKLSKKYPEAKNILTESNINKWKKALKEKRNYLNEDLIINNCHISSYSLKSLKESYNKVAKNIKALKAKIKTASLNESYTASDIRELKKQLKMQSALYYKLYEEINWKYLMLNKNGFALNESDDKEEKNDDTASTSLDDLFNNIENEVEDSDENTDSKEDDKKDSEGAEAELDSVTITMSSEDAANGLKDSLVEKGVPEDAIEVEEVKDEENEDEAKNESLRYSKTFMRLFEDEESDSDDNSDTNEESDSDNNSDNDEKSDNNWSVTLTDTDYINSLKDVMVDEYGYTEDEFWDSIGGKPVDSEDEEDKKSDDEKSDDEKSNDDEESSELDSIGADIFGDA